MEGKWLTDIKDSTIVFVHGILSSGDSCWLNNNGNDWPSIVTNDSSLRDWGVYTFTYSTGIFSGSYRIGDVVDALKTHLKLDDVIKCRKILFVAHSMGGIVVRKYITERALDFNRRDKYLGLLLVASPSLGAGYADWLSPLAKMLGHAQGDALRFVRNNAWLSDLDKEFTNLKERKTIALIGKELIEDKFVTLRGIFRRQVVEPFSGAKYFGEPYKVPLSDHFSISKPEDRNSIQHRLLKDLIKDIDQFAGRWQKSTITYRDRTIPDLSKGSTGNFVKLLQYCLKITCDGIYGDATEAAVKNFQRENNIYPNGDVSFNTWAAMPVLFLGCNGALVSLLQQKLGIAVTGYYDHQTEAEVVDFQVNRGLIGDGIAGPDTLDALDL